MKPEQAMEIYKVEKEKFNATREIQWKFNLAMWTLIAAAIYFFEKRESEENCNCLLIILSIVFFFAHLLFIKLTQKSLGVSKLICKSILEQLNNNSEDIKVSIDRADEDYSTLRDTYWIIFQLTATAVLITTFLSLNI